MYINTTPVQVVRAVATWVLGAGIAMFPLVARSLLAGRPTGAAWACLTIISLGAGAIVGARWRLAQIDHLNRAYLMGPMGYSIMPGRVTFLDRVNLIKRLCLAAFMVVGIVFIVLVSAVNCTEGQPGFCGWAPTPGDALLTFIQVTGIGLGLLYIALTVLTRAHDQETDRLDKIIAHGQHERKHGGPLAGSSGRGWE
ncbi:MAG: hypothetical protein CVT64_01810 [Actinobacteria bacterium HGW-Actinobacteria-4]|nr:MAG: hypothetical protein CVT64_01810 [Actinobacteria bacterium HGW-Actinobacteria-4]